MPVIWRCLNKLPGLWPWSGSECDPRTKVYCDYPFTSLDLIDHMGNHQLGVTGTLRQNRLVGVPLPSKKEALKKLTRGEAQAIYFKDMSVLMWKDNQPVYMASNCDEMEPLGHYKRYSAKEEKFWLYHSPT